MILKEIPMAKKVEPKWWLHVGSWQKNKYSDGGAYCECYLDNGNEYVRGMDNGFQNYSYAEDDKLWLVGLKVTLQVHRSDNGKVSHYMDMHFADLPTIDVLGTLEYGYLPKLMATLKSIEKGLTAEYEQNGWYPDISQKILYLCRILNLAGVIGHNSFSGLPMPATKGNIPAMIDSELRQGERLLVPADASV